MNMSTMYLSLVLEWEDLLAQTFYKEEMKRIALVIEDFNPYEFDLIDFKKSSIYKDEFSLPANIQLLRQGQSQLNTESPPISVPDSIPCPNIPPTVPSNMSNCNDSVPSPSQLVIDETEITAPPPLPDSSNSSVNRNQYPLVERDTETKQRSKKFFDVLGDLKDII